MGKYTMFAEVGEALLGLLRGELAPELLQNPESVALCAPPDRGDAQLGLFLYDVQENEELQTTRPVEIDRNRTRLAPRFYSMFYMMTVYSNAEPKFRAVDEARVLGRALQALNAAPRLDAREVSGDMGAAEPFLNITMLQMNMEEKMRIWTFPNLPYRLSVCLKVAPVEIESSRVRTVRRVVEVATGEKEV